MIEFPRNNVGSVHHLPYRPHVTDKVIALAAFIILVLLITPIEEFAIFKYITSKVKVKK